MSRSINQSLIVYHGTDNGSLPSGYGKVGGAVKFTVSLARGRSLADFGQGFYTTTNEHQAREWANTRVVRLPTVAGLKAVVLAFMIDRDHLAGLECLTFVRPTGDFWDVVWHCRSGFAPHGRRSTTSPSYDVVYGPVTLWSQRLVIADCDQISFHTVQAVSGLRSPTLHAEASVYLF